MGVMELDSVEAGFPGASGGAGEQPRQLTRQLPDMLEMDVRDALACAVIQRLQFPELEHSLQIAARQRRQPAAQTHIVRAVQADRADRAVRIVSLGRREGASMRLGERQEIRKVSRRIRAPPNGQKIDELNEQACFTVARTPHGLDQFPQPGQETLVPYP